MVEVMIQTDFEKNGQEGRAEWAIPPCDLAFVVCVTSKDEGQTYHSDAGIVGGKGLDMLHVSDVLAEAAAVALVELAGDSREGQAHIFAAYVEGITNKAREIMGTAVVKRATELLAEEE